MTSWPNLSFGILIEPSDEAVEGTATYQVPDAFDIDTDSADWLLGRTVIAAWERGGFRWHNDEGSFHRFTYDLQVSPCSTELPEPTSGEEGKAAVKMARDRLSPYSPTYVDALSRVKGTYKLNFTQNRGPEGEPAVTGRVEGHISIEMRWKQIDNIFQAAHVYAHETAHVETATRNGFVSAEASTRMTAAQYKAYRWKGETDAFERQAKVLAEQMENAPWLAACVEQAYQLDPALRPDLTREQREQLIRERYSDDRLQQEWEKYRQDELLEPIRDKVDDYMKGQEIDDLVDHWQP